MKIKTADLLGPPLDWAVDRCNRRGIDYHMVKGRPTPLTSKASTSGGAVVDIMEQEKIGVEFRKQSFGDGIPHWYASHLKNEGGLIRYHGRGPTLRIAVCRCFVASKLGDEVDVPEELLE